MVHREAAERVLNGRYAMRRLVGRGGMGVVWEADDGVLGRRVALKEVEVPEPVGAEADSVKARVLREARAAARLNHPCAVTIYDVVRDDEDRVFIVMELVELPTLMEVVAKQGPLAPERAAALGAQVAEVLQSAHEQGIVHRDVKPANLMVGRGDRVKLADFGIASVKDDSRITATGLVLGSPSFMAPEQAQTSGSGPPADTWGLGATLFFAVEGIPPFDRGSAIATLAAAASEDPPRAERAGPLGPVIARMLSKDPESRPADAELVEALRAVATESSGPREPFDRAAPVTPAWDPPETESYEGLSTPAQRGKALRWLLAFVLVAATIGGLWALGGSRTGGELIRDAERAIQGLDGNAGDSGSPTADAGPEATPDSNSGLGSGGDEGGTPETAAPAIPEGWESYTDPETGYALTYPAGWDVRPQSASATTTDFVDPETGTYLRVDWTDDPGPSPEAAWEQQSDGFAQTHDDYVEIRIDPTVYQGFDAALWEYSYREGDAALHAYNLGFVTPEYGFALNFQTRSENWDESQALFERFQEGFRIPGD